jgi:hypothetical protein
MVSVCKTFFLKTLDLSAAVVRKVNKHAINGSKEADALREESRGESNRTKPEALVVVRSHIESFPLVESQLCSDSVVRQYSDPTLSLRAMYRLYVENVRVRGKLL